MRKYAVSILFAVLLVGASFGAVHVARGQGLGDAPIPIRETQGENMREADVLPQDATAALERAEGAGGQAPTDLDAPNKQAQGENVRKADGSSLDGVQPKISFIESPSATCYQPDPRQNNCFINWFYLSVDAAPNYMITMTLTLNAIGVVAHTQGFFQTSMYVPYNMLDRGIRVPCGALGSGGNPQLGAAYAYTVRARDSAGLKSANYGTVYCPAYRP